MESIFTKFNKTVNKIHFGFAITLNFPIAVRGLQLFSLLPLINSTYILILSCSLPLPFSFKNVRAMEQKCIMTQKPGTAPNPLGSGAWNVS